MEEWRAAARALWAWRITQTPKRESAYDRHIEIRSPADSQGQFLLLQFYNTQEFSLLEAVYIGLVTNTNRQ
jgi:hypothetical protein